MITLIIILLIVVLLLFWRLIKISVKSRNYWSLSFGISFALHYVVPVAYLIIIGNYSSRYSRTTLDDFALMQVCCIIFLISVLLALSFTHGWSSKIDVGSSMLGQCNINIKSAKKLLFAASLIAIVLQYKSFGILFSSELLNNRLIENRGKGYLQLLNIASYFLAFIGIKQYLKNEISFKYLLLHSIPALIIYSLKMQRGHAVYPLVFIVITFFYHKFPIKRANFYTFLVLLSMFYVGPITSQIRTNVLIGRDILELSYDKDKVVSTSFAHAELLTSMVSDNSINEEPSAIIGSLFNWIPRGIYPNKPSSLGPILNYHFCPDEKYNYKDGTHRSSYTTDLLIEGYYEFGYAGIALYGFLYTLLASVVWKNVTKNRDTFFMTFPLCLFIWGFTVFFSDLGNWLGYAILYYAVYFIIKIIYGRTVNQRRYSLKRETGQIH